MNRRRDDPLYRFYRPFFDTRTGQIFMLAAPKAYIRDPLAATHIARHFALPGYEGIIFEPSRPTIQPAENVILVGRSSLFVEEDPKSVRGTKPLTVGYPKLGQRLEEIEKACCYTFEDEDPRVLVNPLTKTTYAAEEKDALGKEVDYAVIRRVFRSAAENTILLEGIHGLGTLGAAKVATTPAYLEEFWEEVSRIERFDPAAPLEILVRTTFDPSTGQEVYALDTIEAKPIQIVYNRTWINHIGQRRWINAEPYDISLEILAEEQGTAASSGIPARPGPYLEVEADLRRLDAETRQLCRELLDPDQVAVSRSAAGENRSGDLLLDRLTAASNLFGVRLHEASAWGTDRVETLPDGTSEIRYLRQRFLVILVLCHLLGTLFVCRDSEIRKRFPEFCRRRYRDSRPLTERFTSTISGRMREGFLPLFGGSKKPRQYMQILFDRKTRSYSLRLERMRLVANFRI